MQISDSHIGFNKAANTDVTGTLRRRSTGSTRCRSAPAFMLHTGDITHLSKPEEFDTRGPADRRGTACRRSTSRASTTCWSTTATLYRERYGKGTQGAGWYSFDHEGVHFVGLVNVVNLKAGGLGSLGDEQLEWLEEDLAGRRASTPIVVFAHIPLWTVYPEWGWGTEDGAQALAYLKRFGSVTVLNGHIHQVMQKVEGNVTFHTAMSTAFPQPAPGTGAVAGADEGPAAGALRELLGTSDVKPSCTSPATLAIVDHPLAEG